MLPIGFTILACLLSNFLTASSIDKTVLPVKPEPQELSESSILTESTSQQPFDPLLSMMNIRIPLTGDLDTAFEHKERKVRDPTDPALLMEDSPCLDIPPYYAFTSSPTIEDDDIRIPSEEQNDDVDLYYHPLAFAPVDDKQFEAIKGVADLRYLQSACLSRDFHPSDFKKLSIFRDDLSISALPKNEFSVGFLALTETGKYREAAKMLNGSEEPVPIIYAAYLGLKYFFDVDSDQHLDYYYQESICIHALAIMYPKILKQLIPVSDKLSDTIYYNFRVFFWTFARVNLLDDVIAGFRSEFSERISVSNYFPIKGVLIFDHKQAFDGLFKLLYSLEPENSFCIVASLISERELEVSTDLFKLLFLSFVKTEHVVQYLLLKNLSQERFELLLHLADLEDLKETRKIMEAEDLRLVPSRRDLILKKDKSPEYVRIRKTFKDLMTTFNQTNTYKVTPLYKPKIASYDRTYKPIPWTASQFDHIKTYDDLMMQRVAYLSLPVNPVIYLQNPWKDLSKRLILKESTKQVDDLIAGLELEKLMALLHNRQSMKLYAYVTVSLLRSSKKLLEFLKSNNYLIEDALKIGLLALAVFDPIQLERIFKETPDAVKLLTAKISSYLFWPILRNGMFTRLFKFFVFDSIAQNYDPKLNCSKKPYDERDIFQISQSNASEYLVTAMSFPHLEMDLISKFKSPDRSQSILDCITASARHAFTPTIYAELLFLRKLSWMLMELADESDLIALNLHFEVNKPSWIKREAFETRLKNRRDELPPSYKRRIYNVVALKKTFDDHKKKSEEHNGKK